MRLQVLLTGIIDRFTRCIENIDNYWALRWTVVQSRVYSHLTHSVPGRGSVVILTLSRIMRLLIGSEWSLLIIIQHLINKVWLICFNWPWALLSFYCDLTLIESLFTSETHTEHIHRCKNVQKQFGLWAPMRERHFLFTGMLGCISLLILVYSVNSCPQGFREDKEMEETYEWGKSCFSQSLVL